MANRLKLLPHTESNVITRCNHAFSLSRSSALWSCNRPEDMELAQRVSETCQTVFPYNRKGNGVGIDQCFICQTVDHIWIEALGKAFEGSLLVFLQELPLKCKLGGQRNPVREKIWKCEKERHEAGALGFLMYCSVAKESIAPEGSFILILSKYRLKMHILYRSFGNGLDLEDKLQLKGCNGRIKPFISH